MIDKRGFELSIGTVVSLVLIIIIFSASLFFIRQFFIKIPAAAENIDKETEAQIRDLLREGNLVALPINKKTLVRGEQDTYWLGIENKLNKQTDFRIAIVFNAAYDTRERPITNVDAAHITQRWALYNPGPYTIPNAAFKAALIRVEAGDTIDLSGTPTPKGYYVFNVCVYHTAQTPPCTQAQADATPDLFYTGKLHKLLIEVV
jgi:hypothetical protein